MRLSVICHPEIRDFSLNSSNTHLQKAGLGDRHPVNDVVLCTRLGILLLLVKPAGQDGVYCSHFQLAAIADGMALSWVVPKTKKLLYLPHNGLLS